MKNVYKIGAIATAIAAMFSATAYADPAETKGGLSIKTEDGRFEGKLGGRIHFDGNLVHEDQHPFNSATAVPTASSGFYFRRIYLTASGKLYGWKYKIEPDFAANNGTGATGIAFQDVLLMTDLGPGELQIGQRKPFRAMEDLTSSNDLLMIERPFASSSGGMFKGGTGGNAADREFQDGLFYHGSGEQYTWGTSLTTLRRENGPGTEGWSSSARGTFAPIGVQDGNVIHVGMSLSYEHPGNNQGAAAAAPFAAGNTPVAIGAGSMNYAGRRGPSATLGVTTSPVTTATLEYANAFGPFFAQAEFMHQHLTGDGGLANSLSASTQSIEAYYLQASYLVTGESRIYKKADGVFSNPKPNGANGAWEITARYDDAKNKDIPGTGIAATTASPANVLACGAAAGGSAAITKCEVKAITFGTNYYVNPNVRFMMNYILGTQDRGTAGKDKPRTLAVRAQLSF